MSSDRQPPGKDPPPPGDEPGDPAARRTSAHVRPRSEGGRTRPAAEPTLPPFDERRLRYEELAACRSLLDPAELLEMLRDGRAVVRANAALGLAAAGRPSGHLVNLLRDSDASVATAATEAVTRLGSDIRPYIPQITQALDGTRPEVTDTIIGLFAQLLTTAEDDLVRALDVNLDLAMRTIVAVCRRVGRRGVDFLIKAAGHEHSRIRINAVAGLAELGRLDSATTMAFLTRLEATDPAPDVRSAARKAMLAVVATPVEEEADELETGIPDFEERKLAASELREHAAAIEVDVMVRALRDGRNHVRVNGARALAVAGAAAGRAARALGLLLRDSASQVRREAARALGRIGDGAIDAADDLVGALGDGNEEVSEAAAETLAGFGEGAMEALIRGLETGSEAHGKRVIELIALLPGAAEVLTEAFRSPAVNVQVNAALGLGLLGRDRIGPGLRALAGARTGGDARTREAVRRALDMIGARDEAGPKPVPIEGFDERYLAIADLEPHRPQLTAADLTVYLQDGRDAVRANAATALGLLGAGGAARLIGVLLRDDAARVRLAAARALDALGEDAIDETADDLVAALGDADREVAEACGAVLRPRAPRLVAALVRGLETDRAEHGRRIVELIGMLDDAVGILTAAFESPAVNVQVNAVLGLGLLGPKRVGRGRKVLDGARTGGWKRTREAVRIAIELLDGPARSGQGSIEIDGFETRALEPDAFAGAALPIEALIHYLQDGRAVVRANAAAALGIAGVAAVEVVRPLAVLLRDDDSRVRIQAAGALDRLGDEAVASTADFLVGALRGDAEVAAACARVLGARSGKVLGALLRGLETDDESHARRVLGLINALPDAGEILCDAFEGPIENVQVNAAIGIGMLGRKRAGAAGRKVLEGARTRGFARTRAAVFKALAMLDAT
jgi:HEAT repeat protein